MNGYQLYPNKGDIKHFNSLTGNYVQISFTYNYTLFILKILISFNEFLKDRTIIYFNRSDKK